MFHKMVLMVVFCLMGVNLVFSAGIPENGNGNIVTIERPVSSSFEKIMLGVQGNVNVYQSDDIRISITIDSNLEEYLQTEIRNNVLEIKSKKRGDLRPMVNTINVYTPNISKLAVSGSGNISFINKITTESLELKISGSGEIKGELECNNLTADISGSGEMIITGKSKTTELNISGSGDYECDGLETDDALIKISGSGDARISVVKNLEGKISGSGDIMYRGNPKITFSGSGSGKIKALD